MHPASIPLAAVATFVAVYLLTPAPVAPQAPAVVAEAPAPGPVRAVAVAAASARPFVPRSARRSRLVRTALRSARRRAAAPRRSAPDVYYPGCWAARAAGVAPILRGEPGYRPEMDGDDDGVACEAPRGRRRRW